MHAMMVFAHERDDVRVWTVFASNNIARLRAHICVLLGRLIGAFASRFRRSCICSNHPFFVDYWLAADHCLYMRR